VLVGVFIELISQRHVGCSKKARRPPRCSTVVSV